MQPFPLPSTTISLSVAAGTWDVGAKAAYETAATKRGGCSADEAHALVSWQQRHASVSLPSTTQGLQLHLGIARTTAHSNGIAAAVQGCEEDFGRSRPRLNQAQLAGLRAAPVSILCCGGSPWGSPSQVRMMGMGQCRASFQHRLLFCMPTPSIPKKQEQWTRSAKI